MPVSLKDQICNFIYKRYRTLSNIIEEFKSSEVVDLLKELIVEGKIETHFVYLKGNRLIFTKKGFDIERFKRSQEKRKNRWKEILKKRREAKKEVKNEGTR